MSTSATIEPRESMEAALDEVRQSRLLINKLDEWLFREIRPFLGRRILEIGCGHGNFTESFLNEDVDLVFATDIDPNSVAIVKSKWETNPKLKARVFDVCDPVDNQLRAEKFDTAFSINVLEHVAQDALGMRHIGEALVEGGRAIIIVPAHGWAYGRMDSSIGHFRRYSKRSLGDKLRAAGFAVERTFYLNVLGLLGWAVNGKVLRKRVPPTGQLNLFNKLVPMIEAVESRVRPPFGLSVVMVARKQSSPN